MTQHTNDTTLRRALLLDAAASGAMGLLLAVAAGALAAPLGLPLALLRWSGLFLVPYAAFLVWLAGRPAAARALGRVVVVGNVGWVVASVLLLFVDALSPTLLGEAFVLAQAAVVTVFVRMQTGALRGAAPRDAMAPAR